MEKRNLLQALGGMGGVGTMSLFSKEATADDQSFYEWCSEYIEELEDAGLTNEQANSYFEDTYGVQCSTGGIQTHSGSIPFGGCVDSWMFADEFCISGQDVTYDGKRTCEFSNTYPEVSYDLTVDVELDDGYVEAGFWIGVSESSMYCIEFGTVPESICKSVCVSNEPTTNSDYVELSEQLVDWLVDNVFEHEPTPTETTVLIVLIAIAFYFLMSEHRNLP